jgi:hypothetical protein
LARVRGAAIESEQFAEKLHAQWQLTSVAKATIERNALTTEVEALRHPKANQLQSQNGPLSKSSMTQTFEDAAG